MSLPPSENDSSPDFEVITLPSTPNFSDGNQDTWPKEAYWKKTDDWLYRHKLAMMWMQRTNRLVKGKRYILDKLPDQYALLDRPRFSDPSVRDKFFYGHPSGAPFNSPNNFFPHFYWLMSGRSNPCPCDPCKKKKFQARTGNGVIPDAPPTAHIRGPGRPSRGISSRGAFKPVTPRRIGDPEGVPDVFRETVTRLSKEGEIDEPISEPQSMDWRAENKLLREQLVRINMQGSYIPRVGEIVLWIPELSNYHELRYNEQSRSHQIYSPKKGRFKGVPDWRAGTISETPDKDPVVLEDLIEPTQKKWAVNYSGFRVETFPDPNDDDKSASLQYRYVHIYVLRPFNSWPTWLKGVPEEEWHPSIKNAMTVMSSLSMVNKYHFKGSWPNASIHCRGIFLGPELILVGDTVRLKPKGAKVGENQQDQLPSVTDVMIVKHIEFKLNTCIEDVQSPHLAKSYSVRVRGHVYTLAPNRAYRKAGEFGSLPLNRQEVVDIFPQVDMNEYGLWYRTHQPGTSVEVSQDMIIGRCFEAPAMELLFDRCSLDFDLYGMLASRYWSRKVDNRIAEGQDWFWADYRVQALGVDTLNGEEVGRYSEARDPRMWKGVLSILDGTASQADYDAAKLPRTAGRQPGRPKSRFADVQKMSSLVSSGLNMDTSANVSSSDNETVNTSEEEEEEESERMEEDLTTTKMSTSNSPFGTNGSIRDSDDDDDDDDDDDEDEGQRQNAAAVLIESCKPLPLPIRGNDGSPVKDHQFKRPRIEL